MRLGRGICSIDTKKRRKNSSKKKEMQDTMRTTSNYFKDTHSYTLVIITYLPSSPIISLSIQAGLFLLLLLLLLI